MSELVGKVVLITGGSEGFGKATAKLFTEEGAIVIIAARNEEKLRAIQNEIDCDDVFKMDVTCPGQWNDCKNFIMKKHGRLDILLNIAGGGISIKETINQTVEAIDQIIMLNLNSVIYGSQVFGKIMKEQGSGTIINFSSVCAKEAWPEWTVYAAAKWGVLGFSKGLYVELQPFNVRVTCLIPAGAATRFQQNAGIDTMNLKLQASDIAEVVADICKLPSHVVVEEMTVWGIDQVINPL